MAAAWSEQQQKRGDARGQPNEWQERVHGPDETALRAGGQEIGEHRGRRAIEDIRIIEARGEIGEDNEKRHRATSERNTSAADDGAITQGSTTPSVSFSS